MILDNLQDDFLKQIKPPLDTTFLTHSFHPYAAKFIPQIPRFLINRYTNEKETILDPFCGSGTSLVESKLLNRNSIGIDINELSVLISKVKTTKIDVEELQLSGTLLQKARKEIIRYYSNGEQSMILDFSEHEDSFIEAINYIVPNFPNLNHWFQPNVIHELEIIKYLIENGNFSSELRNFLLLALSSIIVASSNQESETRYSAIEKNRPKFFVINQFESKIQFMVKRMLEFDKVASDSATSVICHDSRDLQTIIKQETVDFAVTSPPYPNTYDYYLYHKQRMNWLQMNWEKAKNNEIGSRLRYSSHKEDISSFVNDMSKVFEGVYDALKKGGRFVTVVGDSYLKGVKYSGFELLRMVSMESGFIVEQTFSYDLGMSSRTFNKAFRKNGKEEHIIVFKKEER